MQIKDGKIKVSISEINAFVTCRAYHYKVYVEKKEAKSIEFSFGTALHKVCEDLCLAKMGSPSQSAADAPEMFEAFYRQDIEKTKQQDVEGWENQIPSGQSLARLWGKEVFPRLRPKRVEFWVERELIPGSAYFFFGKVDYEDERGFLIDWKTSSKAPSKNNRDPRWEVVLDPHYIMQGLNYLYAENRSVFRPIYLVKDKAQIIELKFPYSVEDLKYMKPYVDQETCNIIQEIHKVYEYKSLPYADGMFKMSPWHYSQCAMCHQKEGCVIL